MFFEFAVTSGLLDIGGGEMGAFFPRSEPRSDHIAKARIAALNEDGNFPLEAPLGVGCTSRGIGFWELA
jgi:hypothetical protein